MRLKLILVDDETKQIKNLENMIDRNAEGFEIVAAFESAEAAISYIKENRVDAIITDIKMPNVTGIDLAKFCRYHYPDIKIVFISAYEDFSYVNEALQYKIAAYIIKPITQNEIIKVLKKIYAPCTNKINDGTQNDFGRIEAQRNLFLELMSAPANYNIIGDKLKLIGIDIDIDSCYMTVYNVKMIDFDKYINSVWYHGDEKLEIAVAQLIIPENIYSYCCMTKFRHDGFEFAAISKRNVEKTVFKEFLKGYAETLKNELWEILGIEIKAELLQDCRSIKNIDKYDADELGNAEAVAKTANDLKCYLNNNYSDENITLEKLSKMMGFSVSYLCSIFKRSVGKSIIDYLSEIRIEAAKQLLIQTEYKASSICGMVGYRYNSYFYKLFKSYTGYTPTEYRKIFK